MRKSNKPFLLIEIKSDNPESILRQYKHSLPVQLDIISGYCVKEWPRIWFVPGLKRFKKISINSNVSMFI